MPTYPYRNAYMDRFEAQNLVSPVSQFDVQNQFLANDWSCSLNPISPIEGSTDVLQTLPLGKIEVPKISMSARSGHELLLDDGNSPTQALVEDLHELVAIINEGWMQKLNHSLPQSLNNITAITGDMAFESGLQILQQCYRGMLPSTLASFFSLMHIAFASAYMFSREDASYSWNIFYQDILRWQHAIKDEGEKGLFLEVADLLWSVPGCSRSLHQGTLRSYGSSLSPLRRNYLETLEESEPFTSSLIPCAQESTVLDLNLSLPVSAKEHITHSDLIKALKEGKVLRACSRYLDG